MKFCIMAQADHGSWGVTHVTHSLTHKRVIIYQHRETHMRSCH